MTATSSGASGATTTSLGIIDARFIPGRVEHLLGAQYVCWSVDDVQATVAVLVSRGATIFEPPTVRGEVWVSDAVVDPFGNILELIQNPQWHGEE